MIWKSNGANRLTPGGVHHKLKKRTEIAVNTIFNDEQRGGNMSIVRVGLGENVDYGHGWEAIFGKGTKSARPAKAARPSKASAKKKPRTTKKKK
jgi:hypothetical protein